MSNTEPPDIRYGSNLQVNFTEIGSCAALFLLIGGLLATVKRFGWGKTLIFFFFSTNILVEASTNLNDVELGPSSVLLLDYIRFNFNEPGTYVTGLLLLVLLLFALFAVKWFGIGNTGVFLITNVVLMMDIFLVMLGFVAVVKILTFFQSLPADSPIAWEKILKNDLTVWIDFDKLENYSGTSLSDIFGYLCTWFNLLDTWSTLSLLSLQLLYCNKVWNRTKIWCHRIKYDNEKLIGTQSCQNLKSLLWDFLQISIMFDLILSRQSINDLSDERKFETYFRSMKCSYTQLCIQDDTGKPRKTPITDDMYDNTPTVVKTTFKDLNTKAVNDGTKEGQTRITNTFPVDMEDAGKRVFAITGEPGSGKTVYLQTLKSYYIKQGLFPFLINFSDLASTKDEKEKLTFPDFLRKYAGLGFVFRDAETFVTWIRKNKNKILILADGLDEHPSLIKGNIPALNLNDEATPDTWLSLLFYGKVHDMEGLKIVFTSKPSSIHNLPQYSRPDVCYSMNGFADESLPSVLHNYSITNDDTDEILTFIKKKGPNFAKLARNPFIFALIALTYKNITEPITSDTKMTRLYELALNQLRYSQHNKNDESWTDETEKSLDKFLYGVFKKGKMEFTEHDIHEHNREEEREAQRRGNKQRCEERNLTLNRVERYTFMKIRTELTTAHIHPSKKIIQPIHNSIMDFHIARYVISQMDITQFETLVQEMFSGKEEDRWVMIRRFISGLINRTEVDKDKIRIFIEQYVRTLNESISQDLGSLNARVGIDQLAQTGILQGHLYNDLLEFNDEQLRSIKEKFTEKLAHLFVIMNDDTYIEGQTYFVRNIKPHLEQLIINIEDVEPMDFIQFAEAIEDLPNKIKHIVITNISPFHGHVEAIGRIFSNTEDLLHMQYPVEDGDFEDIKKQIQAQIDKLEFTNARVRLQHRRGRLHLIRHPSSGRVECFKYNHTSNIWEKSTFDIFDTDLPTNIGKNLFSFTISTNPQFKKLYEILNKFRSIYVGKIALYIPSDVEWNHIHSLIENIKNMEYEVKRIYICNLLLSEVDIDEALRLISDVSIDLDLHYVDELSEDEKVEIWNKLPPVSSLPSELQVIISFNNFHVQRIGDEWEQI